MLAPGIVVGSRNRDQWLQDAEVVYIRSILRQFLFGEWDRGRPTTVGRISRLRRSIRPPSNRSAAPSDRFGQPSLRWADLPSRGVGSRVPPPPGGGLAAVLSSVRKIENRKPGKFRQI